MVLNTETIIILGFLFLLVFLIGFMIVQRKKFNQLNRRFRHYQTLLDDIKPFQSIETNLTRLLELLSEVFTARSYGIYILDENKQRYRLQSIRAFADANGKVGPSYSGLVPYQKQEYQMPMSIMNQGTQMDNGMITEGEIKLIQLAVSGQKAIIRMGPVSKMSKQDQKWLDYFARVLKNPMDSMISAEEYKTKNSILELSDHAIGNLSKLTMDSYKFLTVFLETSKNAFGFSGGCLFLKQGEGYEININTGMLRADAEHLRADKETFAFFENLIKSNETLFVHAKNGQEYQELPKRLQDLNKRVYVFSPHYIENGKGVICFWKEQVPHTSEEHENEFEGVKMVLPKVEAYLKLMSQSVMIRKQNVEKLKMLAQMVDNLTPWTVGYSELMQRYAIIIAKGMQLSEQEISEIGLAAYLSNIGVLGLSSELLYKEGKYSESEFEQMKLHSEVGAAIIENMLSSSSIASYIRHHHERMDGNGYPGGISGDEIPIGARVIAVVQTFLAKINGRSYREPLNFNDALETLKSASGHQLDERLVTILIDWFNNKRKPLIQTDEALGNCWDMLCVPSEVCSQCPVYGQTSKRCWETDRNHCLAHGKTCETCYVYTESLGRTQASLKIGRNENKRSDNRQFAKR